MKAYETSYKLHEYVDNIFNVDSEQNKLVHISTWNNNVTIELGEYSKSTICIIFSSCEREINCVSEYIDTFYILAGTKKVSMIMKEFQEVYDDDHELFQLSLIGNVTSLKQAMNLIGNIIKFTEELKKIRGNFHDII